MARVRKSTTMNIFSLNASNINDDNIDNTDKSDMTDRKFCIDLATDVTIAYVVSLNIFCLSHLQSLKISNFVSNVYVCAFVATLNIVIWCAVFFFGDYLSAIFIIVLHFVALICCVLLFSDMNYTLLYYKKTSFVLHWKLYNVITLFIAQYYLQSKMKMNQFDKSWEMYESIIYSVIVISYITILVLGISLHQGFAVTKINQYWKIIVTLAGIVFVSRIGIIHYFDENLEYQAKILGQKFSIRNLILSKAFDLALWFSYQLYQIIQKPNTLHLLSKIEINWV